MPKAGSRNFNLIRFGCARVKVVDGNIHQKYYNIFSGSWDPSGNILERSRRPAVRNELGSTRTAPKRCALVLLSLSH